MTPAEGQNGNHLPAAVNFPDVPLQVSTESRAWAGVLRAATSELWEEGLGDGRHGKVAGGLGEQAGGLRPGVGQQSGGTRVAGKSWRLTLPYQSGGQKDRVIK